MSKNTKIKKFLKENQGKYTLEEIAKIFKVEVEEVVLVAKSLWGLKKEKEKNAEFLDIYIDRKNKMMSEIEQKIKYKFGYVNFLRTIS